MNIRWQRLLLTPVISLLALAGALALLGTWGAGPLALLGTWGAGPLAAQAQGTIRYVRQYGADSGDCSTPDNACGSIQYAVDQANDSGEQRRHRRRCRHPVQRQRAAQRQRGHR